MKKTFKDRVSDILLALLIPFVHIWMRIDAKSNIHMDKSFDPKRKEPYIMLANHTFKFDVVHVPLHLKVVPYIIASETLFTKFGLRFLLKYVAKVIPKSKGTNDIRTIKLILQALKRNYPILIFPEGDTTFYGKTKNIEFSTAKLVKKLKVDLAICNVTGGYLSNPRWALKKRTHREVDLHYKVAIKKEDLKDMSVEEIYEVIQKELHVNAYDVQREKMVKYPSPGIAEGVENIVYVCPECKSFHSIQTKGNEIKCVSCQTEGIMNDYGFIEGFKFDNLVDWDEFQRNYTDELRNTTYQSDAILYFTDLVGQSRKKIGNINVKYSEGKLYISGKFNIIIDIKKIYNPIVTLRSNLSFEFEGKRFFIKLQKYSAAFIRTLQMKY